MTRDYLSDTLFRRRYSEYAHRSEPVFLQMPVNVDDRMIIMEYSKSTLFNQVFDRMGRPPGTYLMQAMTIGGTRRNCAAAALASMSAASA